jgi:hypothetical protein
LKLLSLRGFDPELEKEIREIARKQGISLNRAAICLLRKGAGLAESDKTKDVVGNSLDHLIGEWSEKESEQLGIKAIAEERTAECRRS